MKVTTLRNIDFKDDIFICPAHEGICISEFEIEFSQEIQLLDKDHCDCIHSLLEIRKNILNVRLVTEKNEIDEFIIFNFSEMNLKIRFQR
mgnify:FL=1